MALILACGTGAVYSWQRAKPDPGEEIRRHTRNADDARRSGRIGHAVSETNAALQLLRRVLKEKVGAADEAELRRIEAEFTSQLSEDLLLAGTLACFCSCRTRRRTCNHVLTCNHCPASATRPLGLPNVPFCPANLMSAQALAAVLRGLCTILATGMCTLGG